MRNNLFLIFLRVENTSLKSRMSNFSIEGYIHGNEEFRLTSVAMQLKGHNTMWWKGNKTNPEEMPGYSPIQSLMDWDNNLFGFVNMVYFISCFLSLTGFFFETGFPCVALAVLELTLETRLASNSDTCLPLPPKCWNYSCVLSLPSFINVFKWILNL